MNRTDSEWQRVVTHRVGSSENLWCAFVVLWCMSGGKLFCFSRTGLLGTLGWSKSSKRNGVVLRLLHFSFQHSAVSFSFDVRKLSEQNYQSTIFLILNHKKESIPAADEVYVSERRCYYGGLLPHFIITCWKQAWQSMLKM